ncbi:MAG TPA: hypothetical protein VIK91_02290, partial [Nannocystis sp.]
LKLAGAIAFVGGYLWLLGTTGTTTAIRDRLLYAKIGVTASIILLACLSRFPRVYAVLARLGLTFTAPNRPRPEPEVPAVDPQSGQSNAPWAYGPAGRLIVGALTIYHMVAIAVWVLPDKDCLSKFRLKAREPFSTWVFATQTDQGWGMFAPNPPRANVFMRVVVYDEHGEAWDLRTDVYAAERRPIPWVWNDRMRKMNRRIIGGEGGGGGWYQQWYARYICRAWALTHRGVMPQKVELYKVSYGIPSPEAVSKQGWYRPERLLFERGRQFVEHTTKCATSEHGQLPNSIRARHGLPLLEEGVFRPRSQGGKKKAWDKRYEQPKTAEKRTTGRPATVNAKLDQGPPTSPPAEAPPAEAPPVEAPPMNED